jgi:hypothetical protein
MKERANFLAIRAWVFFTFNFYDPKEIIDDICENAEGYYDRKHLYDKFCEIYEIYGSRAAMGVFYCELGNSLQKALTEYVIKKFAPNGLILTDEDKEALGI